MAASPSRSSFGVRGLAALAAAKACAASETTVLTAACASARSLSSRALTCPEGLSLHAITTRKAPQSASSLGIPTKRDARQILPDLKGDRNTPSFGSDNVGKHRMGDLGGSFGAYFSPILTLPLGRCCAIVTRARG